MTKQSTGLSQKEINRLNQSLKDLELIRIDIERAKTAGVPACDKLDAGCQEYQEAIAKLKAVYAEGQ